MTLAISHHPQIASSADVSVPFQQSFDEIGVVTIPAHEGRSALPADVGTEEIPHDVALSRHLERTTGVRLRDECVAVWQALTRPTAARVKHLLVRGTVFPRDTFRQGVQLDDPRPTTSKAVVKNEKVAVREDLRIVLTADVLSPFPKQLFFVPIEDGNGVLVSNAHDDVAGLVNSIALVQMLLSHPLHRVGVKEIDVTFPRSGLNSLELETGLVHHIEQRRRFGYFTAIGQD